MDPHDRLLLTSEVLVTGAYGLRSVARPNAWMHAP